MFTSLQPLLLPTHTHTHTRTHLLIVKVCRCSSGLFTMLGERRWTSDLKQQDRKRGRVSSENILMSHIGKVFPLYIYKGLLLGVPVFCSLFYGHIFDKVALFYDSVIIQQIINCNSCWSFWGMFLADVGFQLIDCSGSLLPNFSFHDLDIGG